MFLGRPGWQETQTVEKKICFFMIKVAWCGARRGGADLRLIIGCFFAESKTSTSNNARNLT